MPASVVLKRYDWAIGQREYKEKYLKDTLDSNGVVELAKHFPNNKAMKFLDWFLYSDTSIDGQSKKKAYTLFESSSFMRSM